jgi:hypothetical protein
MLPPSCYAPAFTMLDFSPRMFHVAGTAAPYGRGVICAVLQPALLTAIGAFTPNEPVSLPANLLARNDVPYTRHDVLPEDVDVLLLPNDVSTFSMLKLKSQAC